MKPCKGEGRAERSMEVTGGSCRQCVRCSKALCQVPGQVQCGLVPGSECVFSSDQLLLLPRIPSALLDSNLATETGEARPLLPSLPGTTGKAFTPGFLLSLREGISIFYVESSWPNFLEFQRQLGRPDVSSYPGMS